VATIAVGTTHVLQQNTAIAVITGNANNEPRTLHRCVINRRAAVSCTAPTNR
jgi:hypothetical protein